MKKNILAILLMIALAITTNSHAQVGIGVATADINPSAQLDVTSTSKGFLPPRMTTIQRDAISNPASGLVIFNTSTNSLEYRSSTGWVMLITATATSMGAIGGATPNGATITAGVLSLAPADATFPGVMTTTDQTLAGAKTFSADIKTHGLTIGLGSASIATNTANGVQSLFANTTGAYNTANGFHTLFSNTTGYSNTANGTSSLSANISGFSNTASGHQSLFSNTIGNNNTANGYQSLLSNTGSFNTALGSSALISNTSGNNNTASGYQTLASNTSGAGNTATGFQSMGTNSIGASNTANGYQSLGYNTIGANNTAIGNQALILNTTGNNNTAIGNLALGTNTTGTNNTAIGYGADITSAALTNATAIGNGAIVAASNTIQLGNTAVTDVKTSGTITAGNVTYPNTHNSTAGQVLTTDTSGVVSWVTPSSGGSSTTVGTVAVSSTANGATITSGVLSLAPASATNPGIITTTAQTIAGAKTFSDGITGNVTGNASTATTATTATNVSGTVAIANGGTGATTQNFVDITTAQTIAGAKRFTADILAHGVTLGSGAGAISTNTAIGVASLAANTTGAANTATGYGSLFANIGGNANVANGNQALYTNSSGSNNTAIGTKALYSNTIGNGNTANGFQSLYTNSIGSFNIANGYQALFFNTSGNNNIANGYQALYSNTIGSLNTAYGYQALYTNTIGNNNTAYGYQALRANISGNSNTAIGYNSDVLTGALTNATAIGNGAIVAASNTIQLGNTAVTDIKTSGKYTGSGFATPTGTNAQYLMADGTTSTASAIVIPDALPTIQIGTQKWMKENLNSSFYRNGDAIPQITNATDWASATEGAWCYYNNDPVNGEIYGKLYNWYAVNDPRGLAPTGWHVPTDADFTTLITTLGGTAVAGGKMKEAGTSHWTTPNTGADNSSGFGGLPGGWRNYQGQWVPMGDEGLWWSATEISTQGRYIYLASDSAACNFYGNPKNDGKSVRCLRD